MSRCTVLTNHQERAKDREENQAFWLGFSKFSVKNHRKTIEEDGPTEWLASTSTYLEDRCVAIGRVLIDLRPTDIQLGFGKTWWTGQFLKRNETKRIHLSVKTRRSKMNFHFDFDFVIFAIVLIGIAFVPTASGQQTVFALFVNPQFGFFDE